ncbi:MAG: 50S ribosomal protein L18 [Bacteroidetes bacterium HGW-Bacteroidetes-15]|nr:MAG: 50S ribosomal protein L18 [Bacteroidetes bacterium HGW-Bacteroidetes-15]
MKDPKIRRRSKIKKRIRKTIVGTQERPRLTIFRSNKQIYAQLIDDKTGNTLISASSVKEIEDKKNKIEQAKLIGNLIAEKAKKAGIKEVIFDRNGYMYHGRVKSLAEGVREGGLKM